MAEQLISPSLLKSMKFPPSPNTKKRIKKNFALAPEGFELTDSEDEFMHPKTKKKVTSTRSSSSKRFAEVTTDDQLAAASKGVIPKNTKKSDHWALSAFQDWMKDRNSEASSNNYCPEDILKSNDAKRLSKWLCLFTY